MSISFLLYVSTGKQFSLGFVVRLVIDSLTTDVVRWGCCWLPAGLPIIK
jgi:hypothetical protein